MRNIRNLKDPTAWTWFLLPLLFLLFLFPHSIQADPAKVTCVEYGTTITCDCNNSDQVSQLVNVYIPFSHKKMIS